MSRQLLAAGAAYRQWAPHYDTENVVTTLEDLMVRELTPSPVGMRLLDAACGTARRLHTANAAALRVGVDLVPEMLAAAQKKEHLIAGDLQLLPIATAAFDLIWCRLALSHVPNLDLAYYELARVAAPDASIVITDFHAAASAAGHTRSFRSSTGDWIDVQTFAYDERAHVNAAAAAGLQCIARAERGIGPEVEHFYVASGHLDWYARDRALPLVLGLVFRQT